MSGGRMAVQQEAILTERRARVAELYLEGLTQWAIADQLRVNQSQISRDLQHVRREWLDSAKLNYTELRNRELAAIDQTESEAIESWHCSQLPTEPGGPRRPGNPKFLEIVLSCVRERCRINGTYAPAEVAVTNEQSTRDRLFVAAALESPETQELLAQLTDHLGWRSAATEVRS